jgi:hypothetical protein
MLLLMRRQIVQGRRRCRCVSRYDAEAPSTNRCLFAAADNCHRRSHFFVVAAAAGAGGGGAVMSPRLSAERNHRFIGRHMCCSGARRLTSSASRETASTVVPRSKVMSRLVASGAELLNATKLEHQPSQKPADGKPATLRAQNEIA